MARDGNSLYSRIVGNGLHDCEGKHLLWKMLKSNPKKRRTLRNSHCSESSESSRA